MKRSALLQLLRKHGCHFKREGHCLRHKALDPFVLSWYLENMVTTGQQIWNRMAVLSLFDQTNKFGQIEGRLKIQKLTFLCELEGIKKKTPPLYFRFFRYTLGPFSPELANEIKVLGELGFIATTTGRLTPRGEYALGYFETGIQASEEARKSLKIIKDIAKHYGKRSGQQLMSFVYGLKVPVYDLGGKEMVVKAIPAFLDILDPAHMQDITKAEILDKQLIRDLLEEFAIPSEDLKPGSPARRAAVSAAIRHISLHHRLSA